MSFADERRAIETRMQSNWTHSSVPIQFDNVPSHRGNPTDPWVRLTIMNGDARVAALGNSLHRHGGLIDIDVFVKENSGTAGARVYADSAAAIFKQVTLSAGSSGTIKTGVPRIVRVGARDGWYQLKVSVGYRRDESQS